MKTNIMTPPTDGELLYFLLEHTNIIYDDTLTIDCMDTLLDAMEMHDEENYPNEIDGSAEAKLERESL